MGPASKIWPSIVVIGDSDFTGTVRILSFWTVAGLIKLVVTQNLSNRDGGFLTAGKCQDRIKFC